MDFDDLNFKNDIMIHNDIRDDQRFVVVFSDCRHFSYWREVTTHQSND